MKFGLSPVKELVKRSVELPDVVESEVFEDFASVPAVEFGDFELVGHGDVTNASCGCFSAFWGCSRVDLHNKIGMVKLRVGKEEKVFSTVKKGYFRRTHNSCDKPSCPVCFKYGWAVRAAHNIERRLKAASERFGSVEHVVASVPVRDYGLSYESLRRKVERVLYSVGVWGGVKIFHGFRFHKKKFYWFWSPHFHVLGFIRGGFGRCRHCKGGDCRVCGGVEGRCYEAFDRTGYIVKVLEERETVGGTAWYQLNHASVKKEVKRFHVATWFGVCSYRKLKVKPEEKKKAVCPICRHELEKFRYCGCNPDVNAHRFKLLSEGGRRDFLVDLEEDGRVVWAASVEKGYGSGGYEE
jgi:hypothetical protein